MSKKINIRLIQPGVKKVADYLFGEIYQVDDNPETERLVKSKGFEVVSEADAKKQVTTEKQGGETATDTKQQDQKNNPMGDKK